MKRTLLTGLILIGVAGLWAQVPYGSGVDIQVTPVDPATMTMDGVADEAAWATATTINAANLWDGAWSGNPDPDGIFEAKVLYAPDTLYVFYQFEDFQPLYFIPDSGTWSGEQIMVAFDVSRLMDWSVDDNWSGWNENSPDSGPIGYHFHNEGLGNFWNDVDPFANGWLHGTIFQDDVNYIWGIEMAFWAPGVAEGGQIGFNVGGAQSVAPESGHDGSYAYFSWDAVEYPGGDVLHNAGGFGTLSLVGADETYGSLYEADVYQVDPATMTLDGVADEPEWAEANVFDLANLWDGAWSGNPDPDGIFEGKVLWATDTLYVFVQFEDYQPLYFIPDSGTWSGEQIMVSFDASHAADTSVDDNWSGSNENSPDSGPIGYHFHNAGVGNFWNGVEPFDSAWVRGTIFQDDVNYIWGIEMAFWVPGAAENAQIGFNIGGAQSVAPESGHDGSYAYFSWHAVEYPGGDVLHNAGGFGTLNLLSDPTVAIDRGGEESVPVAYSLTQNYPNPFNPTTTISYDLTNGANVVLSVYNLLGKEVATLVNDVRSAGRHTVTWDAAGLPSGVYLYRLMANGNIIQTRKALLLK
jgi:hypothetical protein